MDDKPIILIIDDDPGILDALAATFSRDYTVLIASSGSEGIEILRTRSDICCVILDIRMPGMDGLETADGIRRVNTAVQIIFYTAYPGDYDQRRIYQRFMPHSYITKAEDPEVLKNAVRNAVEKHVLRFQPDALIQRARTRYGMIGSSKPMVDLYREIEITAKNLLPVLIRGERGTGKQRVAEAIHQLSDRADKAFCELTGSSVDVGFTITKFFGKSQGAFPGANREPGLVELAAGGVLFLDEIADLSLESQPEFLKFLDKGSYASLGSSTMQQADVRFISATNKPLEWLMERGEFRRDLFDRIADKTLVVPPLRDHKEDIPDLVRHFVNYYCSKGSIPHMDLEDGVIEMMMEYDWPGNVRELEIRTRGLVAETDPCSLIQTSLVAAKLKMTTQPMPQGRTYKVDLYELERNYWIRQVRMSSSPSELANRKKCDLAFLLKKLKRFEIDTGLFGLDKGPDNWSD